MIPPDLWTPDTRTIGKNREPPRGECVASSTLPEELSQRFERRVSQAAGLRTRGKAS